MKKKKLSLGRRFPRLLTLGLIIAALAVGFALYRYYFVPQPATVALLVEDGGNGLQMTQTQAQAANDSGATITDTKTGKKVRIINTSKDPNKLFDVIAQIVNPVITGNKTRIIESKIIDATKEPILEGNSCTISCPTGQHCVPNSSGGTCELNLTSNASVPDPAGTAEDETTGMCTTNGSPVKVGTWAPTGGNISGTTIGACVQCQNIKGRFEFAGPPAPCSDKIKAGESVTLPPYADKQPDRYCGSFASSAGGCASCQAAGQQVGVGQSVQQNGETLYCDPKTGNLVKSLCSTTQHWEAGTGCVNNSQPVPAKAPIITQAQKDCEARAANGEKVGWNDSKCRGTAVAGTQVSSASECTSGTTTYITPTSSSPGKLICTGGKPGDVVTSATQCESGLATPLTSATNPGKYKCETCETKINSANPKYSFYTCVGGKSVYHHCPNGVEQFSEDGRRGYKCSSPATPTQPGTTPQTGNNPGAATINPNAGKYDITGKRSAGSSCSVCNYQFETCDHFGSTYYCYEKKSTTLKSDDDSQSGNNPSVVTNIDPATLKNVGKECDSTMAYTDGKGNYYADAEHKYPTTPSCSQLCDKGVDGKIASKPSGGKVYCDTPKLTTNNPSQPEKPSVPTDAEQKAKCEAQITDKNTQTCYKNNQSGLWVLTTKSATPVKNEPDQPKFAEGEECPNNTRCTAECPGKYSMAKVKNGYTISIEYYCGDQSTVEKQLKARGVEATVTEINQVGGVVSIWQRIIDFFRGLFQ